ncbi:McrC family protein [Shewanella sp. YLB-07]|uniref:McrC family protein n=1 Tax=Shewanella sp. YLB-07 TaxID=2601268 RepID=UPI00128B4F84|nr:McrC family protein [Shewanella sp. YLB-07]MPY23831.1 restriction endonuclease [Shewanella sp. YLB-07]
MATWSVYEFARLYRDKVTVFKAGSLHLSSEHFDALKRLMLCTDSDHNQIFRYGFEKREEVLVCQNYVGVICLPNGDQLEILPKISRASVATEHHDQELASIRHSLIKMLKATRHIPSKLANNASLDLTRMPLLDVFIMLFLEEVASLIKRGVARSYQTTEDNLPFLKGKLLVSQQIKHNSVLKHRHYLIFNDFSANRPENRLIRSALLWALKRVTDNTKQLCREYLFHLNDIPESKNIRQDMKSWQRGRHVWHYESIRPWIEMIFNEHSPTSIAGESQMLSMLFPMEKVFEDYVALKLKQQLPDSEVKSQVRQEYLLSHKTLTRETESMLFQLKPDLYITTQGQVIIGDTKWKVIDQSLPSEKYGIKEADIYQMLAYNQTYQKSQRNSEIWLIYPKTNRFSMPIPDFKFDNGSVIKILPFDIETGKLIFSSDVVSTQ